MKEFGFDVLAGSLGLKKYSHGNFIQLPFTSQYMRQKSEFPRPATATPGTATRDNTRRILPAEARDRIEPTSWATLAQGSTAAGRCQL
eukprot:scaffold30024_cov52-Cyclotella_meneghiniana.AAC.3